MCCASRNRLLEQGSNSLFLYDLCQTVYPSPQICMPEIPPVPTGSEGDTQQINQLYSADDRNKTADLNPIRDLLDKRQELSDQIEQLEQEKASIEQQVKLEMQDAAYGTAPGYKVSWVSSESKRVDSQRLKKEQPDIFNRYSKNVSSRRFTIIHAA